MRRRDFIALLGGVFALPRAASAQQASVPVIGFISSRSPDDSAIAPRPRRRGDRMKRRQFIALAGGAAVWPWLARAQPTPAMPARQNINRERPVHQRCPAPGARTALRRCTYGQRRRRGRGLARHAPVRDHAREPPKI